MSLFHAGDTVTVLAATDTFVVPKALLKSESRFAEACLSGRFAMSTVIDLKDFTTETVRRMLDLMTLSYMDRVAPVDRLPRPMYDALVSKGIITGDWYGYDARRPVRLEQGEEELMRLVDFLQSQRALKRFMQQEALKRKAEAAKRVLKVFHAAKSDDDFASVALSVEEGQARNDTTARGEEVDAGVTSDVEMDADVPGGGQLVEGSVDQQEIDPHVNEKWEGLREALQVSEQEAINQENADLSNALIQSKDASLQHADEIVLLSLSRRSQMVVDSILNSSELADMRTRVEDAGCELTPEWADGAILLVPCTCSQEVEHMQLKAHHIVAFGKDVERIREAVRRLPRRRRPFVKEVNKEEGTCATGDSDDRDVNDVSSSRIAAHGNDIEITITVQRTFVNFPVAKDAMEQSDYAVSAPCGVGQYAEPLNPRRWL